MILLLAIARWLAEGGLMISFGYTMMRTLLRIHLPALKSQRINLVGILVITGSTVLWFCLATEQMAGDPNAMIAPPLLVLAASQTLFGQIFLVRLVVLILAVAGILLNWRDGILAMLLGTALVLISVTSHAAAASPAHFTAIGAVGDGLHLLTGGFWIGGLGLLAEFYAKRPKDFSLAVTIFSEWGVIAVTVLILTGMLNAATILLGGEGHDTGAYLAVLGIKLVLVAAMVTLALTNHFRLLPRIAEGDAAILLHKNIVREMMLGIFVVGLAALLGLLQPTM